MDDPGEEWEYEESYDSLVESRKSSLSWLLSKGLWLGKKVVVTGVVISSAPLLIPPLVVATFLGFAVLVPAGVVLVCYTCTQKLMNRLLPYPDSPSTMLEDEEVVVAEKEEGVVVSSDMYFNGIKDIDEQEQGEVAMEEKEQEVVSSDIKDVEEPELDDGSVEKVGMAEKKEEVVSSDISVDSIKDVEEPEQKDRSVEEVTVAEKEQEVINSIKDSEEPEQAEVEPATFVDRESYVQGGNEYNNVVENTGSSDEKSHPTIEDLGGVDKKESSNKETVLSLEAIEVVAVKEQDEVAMAEKEQEVVSADVCVNSIKDSEKPEQNEVEPAKIIDKESYAQVGNTGSSDDKSHPKIEDLGGLDKKKSSDKETVFPHQAIEVITVVQEDTENTDAKKAAEIVMVASTAQDAFGNTAEEKILEEKTTAVLKKIHDDGVKHESSKKKNHKKKSKPVEHTKEAGKVPFEVKDHGKSKVVDRKGQKADDHNGLKGDKTTPEVASSVPTVEMKSVILESSVEESRSTTTTKRDEKPIRNRHVPIVSNQAGETPSNVGENVEFGMKKKESLKEIMIEDKAANDNFDKQRAIHPYTKPKGTTGNIDKRRAESGTGVHKDHPVGGGIPTTKQDGGTHKSILANEKKLWDQIDALRLIVGYKTARRSSLNEEMKALYVFTGVKPPSPFKNFDDIHVTEEKLHFLMSVVGVK